jgi:hypothetical protein
MSYGPILANIAFRTFQYLVDDYVVDHYAAAGGNDHRPVFAGKIPPFLDKRASERLLLESALGEGLAKFPVIRRSGSGFFHPKMTRVVIRTAGSALLLVAFQGWLEYAVARELADTIANALWRHQTSVVFPDPSRYIGPHNIDGLGTPLPTYSGIGHLLTRRR